MALWRVQGNRFDAVDKRFDMADERWAERFDAVDKRFDMAEKLNRERFEMAEKQNRERFDAVDKRFDMAEKLNRERFEADGGNAEPRTLRGDGPAVDGTLRHGRKREP